MPSRATSFSLSLFLCLTLVACAAPPAPTPTRQPPTAIAAPEPTVEVLGEPELVFDWGAQPCDPPAAPDLPVRPFRDSDGLVHVNLSVPTNLSLVGTDFDSLVVNCAPTLTSDFDPNPAAFKFSEWFAAAYTPDGQTVYALIHNEYHGDAGSIGDSQRDLSPAQGARDWFYESWDGARYREMVYDPARELWFGPQPLCQIAWWGLHPDAACQPALTWVSPQDGSITITGAVSDSAPESGNGVIVRILHGEAELWSLTLEPGDAAEYNFDLSADVAAGDAIRFQVDARGDAGFDGTPLHARINFGPEPCPSRVRDHCLLAGVTFALSTDGGRTFTQPPAPDHIVAVPPETYIPDGGSFAYWQPSNIVLNPADGYFYALLHRIYAPLGAGGHVNAACVMRTQMLSDPASWRAWGGEAFDLSLREPGQPPCTIVSGFALTYNLTYNTYLEAFVAVGHASGGVPVNGFYYMLSDDLVNWSRPMLLMPAEFSYTTDGPYLAYPALVDHDSPSPSFDVTGQTVWLYFSRFNSRTFEEVDLMRVQVRFGRE